MNNRQLLI